MLRYTFSKTILIRRWQGNNTHSCFCNCLPRAIIVTSLMTEV